jgi:2-polyprenyl-6-methoxyphenol hydroxylase-like FAD-dependent oxidoreductase
MPQYEFAARRVVSGRRVLVGDAAHMASPRTASGAHTAVLDAAGLLNAFAPLMAGGWGAVVDAALAAYGPPALQRAAALYARSLEVSADVTPPGWRRSSSVKQEL